MIRNLIAPLVVAAGLTLPGAADAVPEQNTLKLSFGKFDVYGTYSRRACSAQATLRSARHQAVGFSVYWRPGRQLYLLTTHPQAGRVSGTQAVQFRFGSGEAVAFNMTRNGNSLYTDIGFGNRAKAFYRLLEANRTLRIEWPSLGDAVDVNLSRRRELEAAMRHCRDWLKS